VCFIIEGRNFTIEGESFTIEENFTIGENFTIEGRCFILLWSDVTKLRHDE
jgi:hypothetical protein